MKLFTHTVYGSNSQKKTKASFNDGLTFNVEFLDSGEVRLFRSRKYRWEPFRSQNHERALQKFLKECNCEHTLLAA